MQLSGCNTFSVGIFAWTSYEPEEGKYDFGWLDRILDRMAEAGSRVALATPSGAKPAWMAKKYPEIRRVNSGDRLHAVGDGRHPQELGGALHHQSDGDGCGTARPGQRWRAWLAQRTPRFS